MIESIQNSIAFGNKNRYGREFSKLDIRQQITVLLDVVGEDHMSRNKPIGNLTKKSRAYIIHQFVSDIKQAGFAIKSILNVNQKHIQAAVDTWNKDKLSIGTINNRLSTLRWLAKAIGKNGMILPPSEYGLSPEDTKRTYIARDDHSWTNKNVYPAEKIAQVRTKDEWVAMHMELMNAFGLRVWESVLMRIRLADCGEVLNVQEGAKGGRPRMVKIDTPEKRRVLDCAAEMTRTTAKGALVRPGKTPKQMLNRIYYVCRKFGITKKELGITPHGLRHQFANDLFEKTAGFPSAVRGGPTVPDRQADTKARHEVTRQLGHARTSITAAYTGARIQGRPRNNPAPDTRAAV